MVGVGRAKCSNSDSKSSNNSGARKLTEAVDVLWDAGSEGVLCSEQIAEDGVQALLDLGCSSTEDSLSLVKEIWW